MPTTLTRTELYALVWAEPMVKLSKRLGLSDRGLAKLCERHRVPVPPRGWWARKAAGHNVRQEPLPALQEGHDEGIVISRSEGRPPPDADAPPEAPEIAFEHQPENRIVVAERLTRPHPFVRRTAEAIRAAKPGDRGLLAPQGDVIDIRVSRREAPRAPRPAHHGHPHQGARCARRRGGLGGRQEGPHRDGPGRVLLGVDD